MPRRRAARLLLAAAVLVLAGCHFDATADLTMEADGTGTLAVTASADREVVEQAPGLAGDLRFDDARATGWTVDGPTATEDGGLRVGLTHDITSAAEGANLLNSLGPPFTDMTLERVASADGDDVTTTLSGRLMLPDGFATFADSDLLAAVGGTPYAARLQDAGATPASALTITLRARLPGKVEDSNGRDDAGTQVWEAPLDGSATPVLLRTHVSPGGGGFASFLSTVLLVLLIAWVVVAGAVVVSVLRARARRARRRRRALSRLR